MTSPMQKESVWPMHFVFLFVSMVTALVCCLLPSHGAAETYVDLELALAVDASASVDEFEYRLQIGGIAAAFRDKDVQGAIRSGPIGKIAVAMVVWAEAEIPKDRTDWFVIGTPQEAERFARVVESFQRRVSGGTGVGAGMAEAMRYMDRNGITATRQVVDVSGDGRETPPRDVVLLVDNARSMALARGVTVNGLAILNDVPDLDRWYRRNVIAGPGAFVMTADDYDDFADAVRRKLIREIEKLPDVAMR